MTDRKSEQDYEETDDLLMNEDMELLDDDLEDDSEEQISSRSARNFNLDMRQRIEQKLEERRLMKELNEYEFFELDDDTLH
jgi:hypothetical protein